MLTMPGACQWFLLTKDMMDKSKERALIGVAVGHAAHDTWFGVAPVLLAALSSPLNLSNADIALVLMIYQTISSITQPFFGHLSERVGGRVLAVTSILWTTMLYCIVILAPTKPVIFGALALAGFSSGAFHPQGAANATVSGGARWGATAASIFFFGGTIGTAFFGSALGGWLLGTHGRHALLWLALITTTLALTVVRAFVPRYVQIPDKAPAASDAAKGAMGGAFWALLSVLLLGTAFRSLAQQSLATFVPKQLQDMGVPTVTYGLVMSLFLFSTAIGGVVGSFLADRIGLARVLAGAMVLSGIALFGYLTLEGMAGYVMLVLTGLSLGPSHTLFIIAGQRQFPQRMATVAGAFLGFTFVTGGGGAWILGLVADRIGLSQALSVLPWALAAGAVCALVAVPRERGLAAAPQQGASSAVKG